MNIFQRRVKKVAKYLGSLRPDLPKREVYKDARSTTRGIIKHVNRDFLREAW